MTAFSRKPSLTRSGNGHPCRAAQRPVKCLSDGGSLRVALGRAVQPQSRACALPFSSASGEQRGTPWDAVGATTRPRSSQANNEGPRPIDLPLMPVPVPSSSSRLRGLLRETEPLLDDGVEASWIVRRALQKPPTLQLMALATRSPPQLRLLRHPCQPPQRAR